MSYTKNDSSRLGSGEESESEEEVVIAPRPKGRPPKNAGDAGKGKKVPEKKSYRCDRCNFSSFSKAKFTKHAKSAHSGTVVQCDHCEFKTPYKWNLDRHYKNHLGGGALCCHICNFSCDIKQSLTVHLQNHHTNVPEEIIESVKRQQIPPRNQSANNPLVNNNNNNNTPPTNTVPLVKDEDPELMENGEKKVPPLRISRSLTGLSLGDDCKEEETSAPGGAEAGNDCSMSSCSSEDKLLRKCDYCEFEVNGVDGNLMKKHLLSQHGIHKKHHHHHGHHTVKRPRSPSLSSSPENHTTGASTSPSAPIVPIPLPPKKNTTKGNTSPRPGQSASSCSNSPAIYRSQSPLKASEAVSNACGAGAFDLATGPASDEDRLHHQSTVLNLSQSHSLKISGEESAFTPVIGADYSSQALSSLKKPKHRALAQFYQKIKPKLTEETAAIPVMAEETAVSLVKEEEDGDALKNSSSPSKSNRCQHCRQRCKSTADLAAHLEKCLDAPVTKKEQSDDVQTNGPVEGVSDGLIGFETAPGVGSIHNGKMEESEYESFEGKDRSGESKPTNELVGEEEDEESEDTTPGNQKSGGGKTGGKSASTTSRKVYRCPENDCSFWATTASRFHVHIVGHYNLKPFECSECHYKSNWRWDVNKHIRLKTPKDPKHASAKTLLTHESGQRDYRRYDNYLVSMSLTHGANSKAPECSTVANKRTKGSGNTVSSPKSSPDLPQQTSPASKDSPSNSPATTKRSPKYAKALAAAAVTSSASSPNQDEVQTAFEYHPSQSNSAVGSRQQQDPTGCNGPVDLATSAASKTQSNGGNSEGRCFVEARTMSGGEIYQHQSLLKQGRTSPEGGDDVPPLGFDLTLKSSHHHGKLEDLTVTQVDRPVAPTPPVSSHPPTKKSRLKQLQQEQFEQQQIREETGAVLCTELTAGNKVQWQCIKCTFKHTNKELVSCHIRDAHKPKKGDSVSLLAHNHFVQVLSPEQAAVDAHLTPGESNGVSGRTAGLSPAQKKEIYPQMYHENGKVLSCKYCPYSTGLLYEMEIHADHHLTKSQSYFSCPHCSYSVAVKSELQEHLRLHGSGILPEIQNRLINSSSNISSPSDRISSSSILSPTSTTDIGKETKPKYHCVDCPYTTNDSSEFQYHRQCHEPHEYPFKCHRCSFNVSVKFHLLQHLRLHGIQIDELGFSDPQSVYSAPPQTSNGPVYEDVSNDYSPPAVQDEPLNLSVSGNRKTVLIWENGVPYEGYRCSMCPDAFRDLADLKEHELSCSQRGMTANDVANGSLSDRECDSPPMEAMNLSFKPAAVSNVPMELTVKKSSQSKVKESSKRSAAVQQVQQLSVPIPPSSPSSVHSAELGGAVGKGEKENLYLCDECPARFFFEKELQIHHTFHENKSTFQCPKCTYSARQKDPHLMSHMRVHGTAYQEKTKALLVKFPCANGGFANSTGSSNATTNAAAAAAAAALSNAAASILSGNFPFPAAAAAAMLTAGGNFKPGDLSQFSFPGEAAALEALRKNGLSIICPKCPEKFYSTQAFQQHYEFHNPSGRADLRCRFCDYCAESRKSLTLHEIVHSTGTGSAADLGAAAFAGKILSGTANAFNSVNMMAMVGHQDHPFSVPNINNHAIGVNGATTTTGETETIDKGSLPVPDEAYEGNPDFVYPTYMKNGRVKSKRYKCTKCPSAFEKKDQYHTHIGLHGSNQKYKCTVCDYAVTYYANYIQHLKKHENQSNIPSDLLAIGRKRHSDDESGINLTTKVPKIGENGDGRSSNGSAESLGTPPHSLSPENRLQNRSSPLVKCSLCPYQGIDQATLEGHLIHHQDNPNWLHVCNICTFRTSSKKSLKEHSKLHLINTYQIQHQQVQNGQHNSSTNGTSSNHPVSNGGHYHEEESSNGSC